MFRPVKHDKASKHNRSKAVKANISMHPFIVVAIIAALAMMVFLTITYLTRYFK